MSLLRTEGLTKHFGGVAAVEDLSFAVEEGEILGLIGPNGSGKTTALNMLSGFLAPEKGRVWLAGEDVTRASTVALARRGLLRMFQMTRIFPRIDKRGERKKERIRVGTPSTSPSGMGTSWPRRTT